MSFKCPFIIEVPHHTPLCTALLPQSATCPAHLNLLDPPAYWQYVESSANNEDPHNVAISGILLFPPFLGPNIFLSTQFSETLGLCYSLNGRDQVLHPYKIQGKITSTHMKDRNAICR